MRNRTVINPNPDQIKIQWYGLEANQPVNIEPDGSVNITGVVSLANTAPLQVTGIQVADLTVLNMPPVNITGTPQVSVVETIQVSGNVAVAPSSTVIISGNGVTQINQTFSINSLIAGNHTTEGIVIKDLESYSYFVKIPSSILSLLTIQAQLSPDNVNYVTIDSWTGAQLVNLNIDLGGTLEISNYLYYVRLFFAWSLLTTLGTITCVFLGQY